MPQLPVRLMLRAEGDWWNAYIGENPANSFKMGSIRMSVVTKNREVKDAFVALMTAAMVDAVEEVYGERPTVTVNAAPESERSGSA